MNVQAETRADLGENKDAYIEKMSRQTKELQEKVSALEGISQERRANDNPNIKKNLDDLRTKLDSALRQLDALKSASEEAWPQNSREVSNTYRTLEQAFESTESKIKRK